MSNILFSSVAVILYLGVAFRLGQRLFQGASTVISKRAPIAVGMGAMTLHGIVLYTTTFTGDGVNLGFFNAVLLLTWIIVLLLLITAMVRPIENLAIALLPLAAFAIVLSLLFPSQDFVLDDAKIGLELHILISVIAFSVLSIAAIQAVLLAVQNNQLRKKRLGGFIRGLPPLETMEHLLFQMIALGFMLQTLSLISGFVFLEDMFQQKKAHHTVLSLGAWIVFAILLGGRYKFGWRGRIAIRWTIGGFVSLLLAYVGSKLVMELLLS